MEINILKLKTDINFGNHYLIRFDNYLDLCIHDGQWDHRAVSHRLMHTLLTISSMKYNGLKVAWGFPFISRMY